VKYAGVNSIDYKLVERLTATSTYPFVLGADLAGIVEHAPAGEGDFRAGDRIFGMARTHGAYAEYTSVAPGVKSEPIAHIPAGVTDEQAFSRRQKAQTVLLASYTPSLNSICFRWCCIDLSNPPDLSGL
jgi:NADPH:quinone reductase-like Zn-dependent oxidoreductase